MKVVELINTAIVLSQIVGRNLEEVGGSEGRDGLFWLKLLMAEKSINGNRLPYYGHTQVDTVLNQEKYFFAKLITLDALTFSLQGIRYGLRGVNRRSYFGSARATNVSGIPAQVYYERVNGGIDVYLYYTPGEIFTLEATGLISLGDVLIDDELDLVMDTFYQLLLIFELAEYMCIFYGISMSPAASTKLKSLRDSIVDINPMDLTLNKVQLIKTGGNYSTLAQINFKDGWTAP